MKSKICLDTHIKNIKNRVKEVPVNLDGEITYHKEVTLTNDETEIVLKLLESIKNGN